MSIPPQAVTDAAFQDNQDHKALQAKMVNPESPVLPEPPEILESPQRLLANQPLHHHANPAHKDLPDRLDPQDHQETQARLEPQDAQEPTLHQDLLDHADHPDHQASLAQSDPTENQESQLNPSLSFQENQANPVTKAQLDLPDHQEPQEMTDLQDPLDQKAKLAPTELQVKTDRLDHQDLPEAVELLARRVFARNTALSTEESSSRMELGVKSTQQEFDSQASQRNAVFLLFLLSSSLLFLHHPTSKSLLSPSGQV